MSGVVFTVTHALVKKFTGPGAGCGHCYEHIRPVSRNIGHLQLCRRHLRPGKQPGSKVLSPISSMAAIEHATCVTLLVHQDAHLGLFTDHGTSSTEQSRCAKYSHVSSWWWSPSAKAPAPGSYLIEFTAGRLQGCQRQYYLVVHPELRR